MLDSHEVQQVVNEFLSVYSRDLNVQISDKLADNRYDVIVNINGDDYKFSHTIDLASLKAQIKFLSKNDAYDALSSYTGLQIPWGSHTGVRPVSLVHQLLYDYKAKDIADLLKEDYRISGEKAKLSLDIALIQKDLLNRDKMSVDIYISIPFCVSRCNYCSFSLVGIEKKGKLHGAYIDSLCHEIRAVGESVINSGYKVRSIYFGGGTPTAISAELLEQLFECVKGVFGFECEVTLEAGRADTIDEAKLKALKKYNISRININPQTMNEKTLIEIGRNHSPGDVISAFHMAREYGYDNINMDVIAGLPGETLNDFKYTLDSVVNLCPESITVHTFALKRASRLKKQEYAIKGDTSVNSMLDYSYDLLARYGYLPYYLYRQKNMEDNGENVGFCMAGRECLYNIDIMEENTHILALGSGGISKRICQGHLIRRSDPKDIEVYIDRIEKTIRESIEFFS